MKKFNEYLEEVQQYDEIESDALVKAKKLLSGTKEEEKEEEKEEKPEVGSRADHKMKAGGYFKGKVIESIKNGKATLVGWRGEIPVSELVKSKNQRGRISQEKAEKSLKTAKVYTVPKKNIKDLRK